MKKLTDDEILTAILENGSIKQAAGKLGCNTRTIYERTRKPEFQEKYTAAKSELLKAVTAKLQNSVCVAVDTLASIVKNKENAPQVRINAAAAILQYTQKFTVTTDIIERLEKLERGAAV